MATRRSPAGFITMCWTDDQNTLKYMAEVLKMGAPLKAIHVNCKHHHAAPGRKQSGKQASERAYTGRAVSPESAKSFFWQLQNNTTLTEFTMNSEDKQQSS